MAVNCCNARLRPLLEPLARRKHRLRLAVALAGGWSLTGVVGLGVMALEHAIGWSSSLALPLVGLLGLALTWLVILRWGRYAPDWRSLARQIETEQPDLDGRLLTAVQQPDSPAEPGYLQGRLLNETVAHYDQNNWGTSVPGSRLLAAFAAQACALVFAAVVLSGLRVPGTHRLVVPQSEVGVTITPGDADLERGSSLVVLAEFKGRVPPRADLVLGSGDSLARLPLVRSLADPLFGATVPEVTSNLVYHLEYAGHQTRDFKVTVFEYPRLERADAEITFPEYTGQKPQRIENTRRLSAVEGSRVNLSVRLNKPVRLARLTAKEAPQGTLSLLVDSNAPSAVLDSFRLDRNATYELQLVDLEGRTNKMPAQFVFQALKNRVPELKMAMPRGDTRPSALEEIAFEGTVWDDFGVQAYGLAFSVPGRDLNVVELGRDVPAKEKHGFKHLLRLEELGVQPNDLLSWFVWADDIGPDGKSRRTTGDLFFAEVRPFEEIFRQGQSMSGGQEQQQGQSGNQSPAGRVSELQKQIINATWNLFRRTGASFQPSGSSDSSTNAVDRAPSPRSSGIGNALPPLSWAGRGTNGGGVRSSELGRLRVDVAIPRALDVAFRINTPLQRGARTGDEAPNRFNGLRGALETGLETVETVPRNSGEPITQLKRGVNESTSVALTSLRSHSLSSSPSSLRFLSNQPIPGTSMPEAEIAAGPVSFRAQVAGQVAPSNSERRSRGSARSAVREQESRSLPDDLGVVTDAQAQAIEQAQTARERQQDPRSAGLWEAAIQQMERALERLKAATNSSASFREALAAEQAAYQALLKLQEREYSVTRSRNRQGSQGGRQQQMQRQLDQLDLTPDENRYETERQAQPPQSNERREQLQVMNRLQELARRQQDVNERLKELQTALQEARTEKEREEIRRQLKRLQEEEQQLLADADEVRQRMDRPENQASMSEQRRQLEQAREDLRRAAEATEQGQPSQALASGTRAQRQFQQMREDLRRQSASEFEEDLKRMRGEARELARQQEDIRRQLESMNDPGRRNLSDSELNRETLDELARQAKRLTNLVQSATQLSQQAEAAEPLMSRELYDALRKFSQNESATLKEFQEEMMKELMTRGRTSRELYDRVKRIGEQSGSKALDLTSEMLRQGLVPDATSTEQRARAGINDLKRGVERAAESVLGDDAESLRLAQQELDRLTDQLRREIAQGEERDGGRGTRDEGREAGTNQPSQLASTSEKGADQNRSNARRGSGARQQQQEQTEPRPNQSGEQARSRSGNQRSTEQQTSQITPGVETQPGSAQPAAVDENSQQNRERSQDGQSSQSGSQRDLAQAGGQSNSQNAPSLRPSSPTPRPSSPRSGRRTGGLRNPQDFDRLFDGRGGGQWGGPITGEDFAPWSDSLRNVEELVDMPALRSDVARARERARQMRQDFRRDQQKPDWAVVRLQVLRPLVEVRDAIAEELARREPQDNLVPIDRDPVPERYSELVRRYYEELGKARAPREGTGTGQD